jgi:hypothetical protein
MGQKWFFVSLALVIVCLLVELSGFAVEVYDFCASTKAVQIIGPRLHH